MKRFENYIIVFLFIGVVIGWKVLFEKIIGISAPDFLYAFILVYVLGVQLRKLPLSFSAYVATLCFSCIPFSIMGKRTDIAETISIIGFLISVYILINLFFHIRREEL